MIYILSYFFIYSNAYIIIDNYYSRQYNYFTKNNNEMIHENAHFYYSIINIHYFSLVIYLFYIVQQIIYAKNINKNSFGLSIIYLKYILNVIFNNNMSLFQYELNRNIMWLFATPLMIKMYCDVNHLKLKDMLLQYHVIPIGVNIFIYSYRNTIIYYIFIVVSFIMMFFFVKNLYNKHDLLFTNIYINIWSVFIFLNILDIFEILNKYNLNLYYTFADMISKITINIVINDYIEKEFVIKNNIDLQTIQFISYILKSVKEYEINNIYKTQPTIDFINNIKKNFKDIIPEDKTIFGKELLKKILPFNFDKEYIEKNVNLNVIEDVNINANKSTNIKSFNMICILFTDIVNYTELAKKYDDKIIFKLLSSIYTLFDNIIKQYSHLQKIETIGDAYMVVGDIFRTNNNHILVIKEIITFAINILKEIKTVKTPDNIPLSIRIGINIGNVSIGILGNEIPRLCVVGNSVNIASRLQSTAEIDSIQFSRHIYEKMEDINFDNPFEIIKKENVFLKNIGSVTTYNIFL